MVCRLKNIEFKRWKFSDSLFSHNFFFFIKRKHHEYQWLVRADFCMLFLISHNGTPWCHWQIHLEVQMCGGPHTSKHQKLWSVKLHSMRFKQQQSDVLVWPPIKHSQWYQSTFFNILLTKLSFFVCFGSEKTCHFHHWCTKKNQLPSMLADSLVQLLQCCWTNITVKVGSTCLCCLSLDNSLVD